MFLLKYDCKETRLKLFMSRLSFSGGQEQNFLVSLSTSMILSNYLSPAEGAEFDGSSEEKKSESFESGAWHWSQATNLRLSLAPALPANFFSN